jgi:hypothetical protein
MAVLQKVQQKGWPYEPKQLLQRGPFAKWNRPLPAQQLRRREEQQYVQDRVTTEP